MFGRFGWRAAGKLAQRDFLEQLAASRIEVPRRLRKESATLVFGDANQAVDAEAASGGVKGLNRWLFLPVAALAVGGTVAATQKEELNLPPYGSSGQLRLGPPHAPDWVQEVAAADGISEILTGSTLDTHAFIKRDHMFSALLRHDLVKDLVCYYDRSKQQMKYVIQLGSDVCGYPRIVHGGLTAAIIDESFGFLFYSLRRNGQLPFRGPAFTAHLEVNYKRKIQAGRLLLCTTEVESMEGRKLWMKATLRDGPEGKVYATARALFVVPKTTRLLSEGWRYAVSALFPASKVTFE